MKRLIKYSSPYNEVEFSNCSTKYEVLPIVVPDGAGPKELEKCADSLGIKIIEPAKQVKEKYNRHGLKITHSVKIGNESTNSYGERKNTDIRLGFITIDEQMPHDFPIVEKCDGLITKDSADRIFNEGRFYMRDVIALDSISPDHLLIESWDAFHFLEVLGYKFQDLLDVLEVSETVFDDSVFQCSSCGEWDSNDSGYTYNYRVVDCEILGTNKCNCYNEHSLENFADKADDPKSCIELETAETLESGGKLEHLERFIGGMTDGRGGYYNGESVSESSPEEALAKYQGEYPDDSFIFTHDDSGQFQTYFSIWKINN